jgi:hypothetical protein
MSPFFSSNPSLSQILAISCHSWVWCVLCKDVVHSSLQYLPKPSSFFPGVQSAVLPPADCRCEISASAASAVSAFSGTKISGPRHTTVRRVEQRKVIRSAMEEGDIKPDNSSGELPELLTEAAAGRYVCSFYSAEGRAKWKQLVTL